MDALWIVMLEECFDVSRFRKRRGRRGWLSASIPRNDMTTLKKRVATKTAKYNPVAPERVTEILAILQQEYPDVRCALHHENAWQLLVATILSAQCTDVRVNMVTPALFKKYPTPESMAKVEPETIEPMIRTTGFFRNKAKNIVGAARRLVDEFGGKVPETMDELLTLPGVARKTANVVLGSWFGHGIGDRGGYACAPDFKAAGTDKV